MIKDEDIKMLFFKTIKGDMSASDFEKRVYADENIEKHLSSDDYLELISFNFNKRGAFYELKPLLVKHIDLAEFETWKMLSLLYEAKQKNDKLPQILSEFYNLYCIGYNFLFDLGLGYGLVIDSPGISDGSECSWENLSAKRQQEILNSFSPQLDKCIADAITWIETKKIVLTGARPIRKLLRIRRLQNRRGTKIENLDKNSLTGQKHKTIKKLRKILM